MYKLSVLVLTSICMMGKWWQKVWQMILSIRNLLIFSI